MVSLAKERLARFGDRAKVMLTDGSPRLDFRPDAFDRFVSCYVLDLMAFEDIRKVLLEANRILSTGGPHRFATGTDLI
jgi:ubiquinone/menaquinone biosynthesis C-methylase UbiE